MVVEKNGDILESGANCICQQVNCRGAMNSGLAGYIKKRYPMVARAYLDRVASAKKDSSDLEDYGLLGRVQVVEIDEDHCILNLFSQNKYGRDGAQYTDYPSLQVCLNTIRDYIDKEVLIAIPYGIGCGLGGGDWSVVSKMIYDTLKDHNVEIWKLDKEVKKREK